MTTESPRNTIVAEIDQVFQRDTQAGWLILSAAVPSLGQDYPELAEHIVQRMNLAHPAASLLLGPVPPQGWVELLEGVEALFGYSVAHLDAGEPPPAELVNAGLVMLGGGDELGWMAALDGTRLEELILRALKTGALIVATGAAAGVVGSWTMLPGDDDPQPGLNWLPGAIVLPDESQPAARDEIQYLLSAHRRAYALGLLPLSVVALGPSGEIEVWGKVQPVLVLGHGWEEL